MPKDVLEQKHPARIAKFIEANVMLKVVLLPRGKICGHLNLFVPILIAFSSVAPLKSCHHDYHWHRCLCVSLLSPPTMNYMMTSSNENVFRVTGHLCREFTGPRWNPRTKAVTRSFDVFFDLHLNKWLSKQSWGWWFETLSCPLWRHCNAEQSRAIGEGNSLSCKCAAIWTGVVTNRKTPLRLLAGSLPYASATLHDTLP